MEKKVLNYMNNKIINRVNSKSIFDLSYVFKTILVKEINFHYNSNEILLVDRLSDGIKLKLQYIFHYFTNK